MLNSTKVAGTQSRVFSGKAIAHLHHLNKRQLAALAADLIEGLREVHLNVRQAAQLLSVSDTYIRKALQLSPEKRSAILSGKDSTSFAVLDPPKLKLALPAPAAHERFVAAARELGVDTALEILVATEQQSATESIAA